MSTEIENFPSQKSYALEKIETQKIIMDTVRTHLKKLKVKNPLMADLPFTNNYFYKFVKKEFDANYLARESKECTFKKAKAGRLFPDNGVDYELGNLLDVRGKKFAAVNLDGMRAFTREDLQCVLNFIIHNEWEKKAVFITTNSFRRGTNDTDFKNFKFPDAIDTQFRMKGYTNVECKRIHYADVNFADGTENVNAMDMYIYIFIVG